jgi:hypothetical protein
MIILTPNTGFLLLRLDGGVRVLAMLGRGFRLDRRGHGQRSGGPLIVDNSHGFTYNDRLALRLDRLPFDNARDDGLFLLAILLWFRRSWRRYVNMDALLNASRLSLRLGMQHRRAAVAIPAASRSMFVQNAPGK